MIQKEKFLQMKSYQELDKHRDKLIRMKPNREIINHLSEIMSRMNHSQEELYKTPKNKGGTIER